MATVEFYPVKQRVANVNGQRTYADRYNWRVRADNGNVVCSSQQGFGSVADARRSVEAVKSTFSTKTLKEKVL